MKNEIPQIWHSAIENAMTEVMKNFVVPPHSIILTESDLKCWLFSMLLPQANDGGYTVHSEITHYHKQERHVGQKRKYHLRDISLLDPEYIELNEEIVKDDENLSKGFRYRGPAIHLELKFVRQPIGENKSVISPSDLANLQQYIRTEMQKHFVIVWGSRSNRYSVSQMKDYFLANSKEISNEIKSRTTVYLFDRERLCKGYYDMSKQDLVFQ
jgi:hypothetical protein